MLFKSFLILLHCGILKLVLCGDIYIGSHPSSLEFVNASPVKVSNLEDLLAASLGYTTENVPWEGLRVKSAFGYPHAAVIFNAPTSGAEVFLDGQSYELIEDVPVESSLAGLHDWIFARAQRSIHFKTYQGDDYDGVFEPAKLPKLKKLQMSETADSSFLREITMMPSLMEKIGNVSIKSSGGQGIFFVTVDNFNVLVKNYGKDSKQVSEAKDLLSAALLRATDKLKEIYSGRVLVATVFTSDSAPLSRKTRSLLQSSSETINLSSVYSADFPVIFNIVLILSILFFVAILAVSMAMAFMDPGRDSIIYRMTNPRMKKD